MPYYTARLSDGSSFDFEDPRDLHRLMGDALSSGYLGIRDKQPGPEAHTAYNDIGETAIFASQVISITRKPGNR